jgi:hypothetical protein
MMSATAAGIALAMAATGAAGAAPGGGDGTGTPPPASGTARTGGPGAVADHQLPRGWRFSGTGADRELVWAAPKKIRMGGARVEFHGTGGPIGVPVPGADGRTFRLKVGAGNVPGGLKVLASGRRLDAGPPRSSAALRPPAPPAPAAVLPANPVDPGRPGPYRTVTSGEYDLPPLALPGLPNPVEVKGIVVGPVGAPGKQPLTLFLHGRHYTCFNAAGGEGMTWPCAGGLKPVPSHRGYLHDQQLLASQGHVTVSIAANGINGQDHFARDGGAQARSSLVRTHLSHWADWAADPSKAPAAVRAVPAADLSRVLLVGHSRGGEGVNRASLDSLHRPPAALDGHRGPVRWKIRGNVLIGPTLFGQNPAPDVPSVTLLPGCDGDVSDLQGQMYVDTAARSAGRGTALHSAVYLVGANHNYFNSEWTPGQAEAPAFDDFAEWETPDPVCSVGAPTRLTAGQQQTAGSVYIAAAARLFTDGDDKVRPLLDGSGFRAPSAGPVRAYSHAVGGHRTPVLAPYGSPSVIGAGRACPQKLSAPRTCLPPENGTSPHFAHPAFWDDPGRFSARLSWSRPGAVAEAGPRRVFSLAGSHSLALRLAVPPNTTGTRLDVAVQDTSGRIAHLGRVSADGLPGTSRTASHWAQELRVPLTAAGPAKVDLSRLRAIRLTSRTASGTAWLVDARGWRPGTPQVVPAQLPRLDIGELTVNEGNAGVRTLKVPVTVSGKGTGRVRLHVPGTGHEPLDPREYTVGAGAGEINLSRTVRGNTRFAWDERYDVWAQSVSGAVVGSYTGGITVLNDDPMPTPTITPVADRVTEGQELSWRVRLSAPADVPLDHVAFRFLPVTTGPELHTSDLDRPWLEYHFGVVPDPPVPFSSLWDGPVLWASVPAGSVTATVSVATAADTVAEPAESLRFETLIADETGESVPGPVFTGTVLDSGTRP